MKAIRFIKGVFLSMFCYRYWDELPKEEKPGVWIAQALRTSPWSERVMHEKEYSNNVDAYIGARWFALKLDFSTGTYNGMDDYGIEWLIKKGDGSNE